MWSSWYEAIDISTCGDPSTKEGGEGFGRGGAGQGPLVLVGERGPARLCSACQRRVGRLSGPLLLPWLTGCA